MNDLNIIGLGGLSGIKTALTSQADHPAVKSLVMKAQELYSRDEQFKVEIDRAAENYSNEEATSSELDFSQDDPRFEGMSDAEREKVLEMMGKSPVSGDESHSDSRHKKGNGKLLAGVALAAVAIGAAIMFRGVVFRALYVLIVKLPFIGPVIKRRFGTPKNILDGRLSDGSLKQLAQDVSELESLTGLQGKFKGEYKLIRFLELVRNVSINDIRTVYESAEAVKILR